MQRGLSFNWLRSKSGLVSWHGNSHTLSSTKSNQFLHAYSLLKLVCVVFFFLFRKCQAVGKKANYSLRQLWSGRSETVLCNHEQETVGGYRLGMIRNVWSKISCMNSTHSILSVALFLKQDLEVNICWLTTCTGLSMIVPSN